MDIYILDEFFRRASLVDRYESFIWTERVSAYGDFELVLASTPEARRTFVDGTMFAIRQSRRVMKADTAVKGVDEEGRRILTITGKSLEAIFDERPAALSMTPPNPDAPTVLTGKPGDIVRQLARKICIEGVLHAGDIIPDMTEGMPWPVNTLPEHAEVIQYELPTDATLYEAIQTICESYDLGFRLTLGAQDKLRFEVYSGFDKTTRQQAYPAVIFSPKLDNLESSDELQSSAQYKNVALVTGKAVRMFVYDPLADPSSKGFQRRVMNVKMDNEPTNLTAARALATQLGLEALAGQKRVHALDGQISEYADYIYDGDYSLGDLTEMRNEDDITNFMRVTEQIFSADSEGIKMFPTLMLSEFITPGSWRDWKYATQVWRTAPGEWATQ